MINIETIEFKEWFGKSKVIDSDKKPLSVFHGTTGDFSVFKTNPLQKQSINGLGFNAIGSCFSESRDNAASYPFHMKLDEVNKRKVIQVYLSIQNPKKYRSIHSLIRDMNEFYTENDIYYIGFNTKMALNSVEQFKRHLKKQGYDGITYLEGPSYNIRKNKARVWVAFEPEQIKITQIHKVESK